MSEDMLNKYACADLERGSGRSGPPPPPLEKFSGSAPEYVTLFMKVEREKQNVAEGNKTKE